MNVKNGQLANWPLAAGWNKEAAGEVAAGRWPEKEKRTRESLTLASGQRPVSQLAGRPARCGALL
jgi:hypothetical protein